QAWQSGARIPEAPDQHAFGPTIHNSCLCSFSIVRWSRSTIFCHLTVSSQATIFIKRFRNVELHLCAMTTPAIFNCGTDNAQYYSAMVEWGARFDARIFLHAADREWVMRESGRIQFWEGKTLSLWDGLTLIHCGGHFEGGAILHWPAAADGQGALLTGDIIQV